MQLWSLISRTCNSQSSEFCKIQERAVDVPGTRASGIVAALKSPKTMSASQWRHKSSTESNFAWNISFSSASHISVRVYTATRDIKPRLYFSLFRIIRIITAAHYMHHHSYALYASSLLGIRIRIITESIPSLFYMAKLKKMASIIKSGCMCC